jgi:hypothetical protein
LNINPEGLQDLGNGKRLIEGYRPKLIAQTKDHRGKFVSPRGFCRQLGKAEHRSDSGPKEEESSLIFGDRSPPPRVF